MAKRTANKDPMDIIRQRLGAISLEDKMDVRTYVHLLKHGLAKGRSGAKDITTIEQAFRETKSLCNIPGPFIFYRPDESKGTRVVMTIYHVILNRSPKVRKLTSEYLLKEEMATYMCPQVLDMIRESVGVVSSRSRKKWIPAAVKLSDAIENDWLLNYQGVLQAVKMNFDDGIGKCLTKIMCPDTSALGAMGKGVLTPSRSQDEIKGRVREIVAKASEFTAALQEYYMGFGHIPLAADMSVCSLYNEWVRTMGPVEDTWQLFWEWAASLTSPLARYHVCYFFANNPELIPADAKQQFVKEVIAVICPSEEDKGQWFEAWTSRCELARYYCEYLECRLPGASGEKITTQAWWLADKVADVCGDDPENIKRFREQTVEPEESSTSIIWQLTHLATEPSFLRYATLYVKNLWSLSLVSQLCSETLEILLSAATETQKKAIDAAVAGNLVNLFPIRRADDKLVFAFDKGCVEPARALAKSGYEEQDKEMLSSFIDGVAKITSEAGLRDSLKRLPEGNATDQMLSAHAVHILANMDRVPKEFIWDCLVDKDWVKRTFVGLNAMCAEHLFGGLNEIQLRTKGKWDEQLPHLYATLSEELGEDEEKRKLSFAFTVISSLAANSVSAVDRLLKGKGRFNYQEEVGYWRRKIEYSIPLIPQWCRARLRAMLASLYV